MTAFGRKLIVEYMTNLTKRLTVLVTASEKAIIKKRAKEAGLSISEFMRRAARSYDFQEDVVTLNFMIDEMNNATERTEKAIDEMIKYVDASNRRISRLEDEHKIIT